MPFTHSRYFKLVVFHCVADGLVESFAFATTVGHHLTKAHKFVLCSRLATRFL